MSTVRLFFSDGVNDYTFPLAQSVSDPKEGMKATVIEGKRGSGSIVIKGGKKSQEITIRGKIAHEDGYMNITSAMNEMREKVSDDVATLSMQYWNGASWVDDWSYTVQRIEEIEFPDSMRTWVQDYSARFLVLSY